jgi:glycosyltransferase involved in cell wall biosynthesis
MTRPTLDGSEQAEAGPGQTSDTVRPESTWCGEVELSSRDLPSLPRTADGRLFEDARVLVRVHGDPVGYVQLPLAEGRLDATEVLRQAVEQFGPNIRRHLAAEGLEEADLSPAPAATARCSLATPRATRRRSAAAVPVQPAATVVVCTRNRPEILLVCLDRLRRLRHPNIEIVIVDNAPSDESTKVAFTSAVADLPHFRYVREERPGLSWARNRGVAEARGEIIAFTDDDVAVDEAWIAGILRGFAQGDDIGCVTGLVATASLTEVAERYFDSRLNWSASCAARRYDLVDHREPSPVYPFSAGIFGAGANIAFRRAALASIGEFDTALGAGTAAAGGEDLDIFLRVLLAGFAIYYEPASLVWHTHRSSVDELNRQMFAYGSGMAAYLTKHLIDPRTARRLMARVPRGLWEMRKISTDSQGAAGSDDALQRRLLAWELAGYAAGPALYAKSRRRSAGLGGSRPATTVVAPDVLGAAALPDAAEPSPGSPTGLVCGELELAGPRVRLPAGDHDGAYGRARLLVRVHGEPVGYVELPLAADGDAPVGVDVEQAVSLAVRTLGGRIRQHLADDGVTLPAAPDPGVVVKAVRSGAPHRPCRRLAGAAPRISVVVCTRNRPGLLPACLDGLLGLRYENFEVVVVDNAPSDDGTRVAFTAAVGTDERFRYVVEPVPGLSSARNRGLAEASGEIIAYTDDDVRVDTDWLLGIARGFARRDDVACVTGLVGSADLATDIEQYFDAKVSWSTSCAPRVYDMDPANAPGPLHPFTAGVFGTGANLALRTETVRALGGFDTALGAGTKTRGGEDLDIFVRILLDGHALAYEPAALVWHSHRSDLAELSRQMFGYGSGLTAYIAKYLVDPATCRRVVAGIPGGLRHARQLGSRTREIPTAPKPEIMRRLRTREMAGMLAGPVLYLQARRRSARASARGAQQ